MRGIAVAVFLTGFSLAPFIAFAVSGGRAVTFESLIEPLGRPGIAAALRFSLAQALCSTAVALAVGLPGAWLTGRYRFRGRAFLMALSALPFCLPPLLVVLSFVSYYGKAGLATRTLLALGFPAEGSGAFLYGFWGIVTVHAFYNFPIVLQTVGAVWSRIPRTKEEAARTLGANPLKAFAAGTLPSLMPAIAQSAILVFLFCFFSFTVVLVFGSLSGSTLEVEIYRAARFSGDRAAALSLAFVQGAIALVAVALMGALDGRTRAVERDLGKVGAGQRPDIGTRIIIGVYFLLIGVFFIGPLASLTLQAFTVRNNPGGLATLGLGNFARLLGFGAAGTSLLGSPLARALRGTLSTAVPATLIALVLGMLAAMASRKGAQGRFASRVLELSFTLPLAASSAVTALGFGLLFPSGAIAAVSAAQASMIWPFTARAISGALSALDNRSRSAARLLGASPLRAFLDTDVRTIGPSILAAGAFTFSMAAGDANAPLILGRGEIETLPLLVYRLASSYRFPEACAAGTILALLAALVFLIKERSVE